MTKYAIRRTCNVLTLRPTYSRISHILKERRRKKNQQIQAFFFLLSRLSSFWVDGILASLRRSYCTNKHTNVGWCKSGERIRYGHCIYVCGSARADDEWDCSTTIFRFSTTITKLNKNFTRPPSKYTIQHRIYIYATHSRQFKKATWNGTKRTKNEKLLRTFTIRIEKWSKGNKDNVEREKKIEKFTLANVMCCTQMTKKCTRNISIRAVIK